MKKFVLSLLIPLFIGLTLSAQQTASRNFFDRDSTHMTKLEIDYEKIAEEARDSTLYIRLFEKFVTMKPVSDEELALLYYGLPQQRIFLGGTNYDMECVDVSMMLREEKFREALDKVRIILKINPFNIYAYELYYQASSGLGEPQQARAEYNYRHWRLMEMIARTGDGRTRETALKICTISEEYVMMRQYFRNINSVGRKSYSEHEGDPNIRYDQFLVTPNDVYGNGELWFDKLLYYAEPKVVKNRPEPNSGNE